MYFKIELIFFKFISGIKYPSTECHWTSEIRRLLQLRGVAGKANSKNKVHQSTNLLQSEYYFDIIFSIHC